MLASDIERLLCERHGELFKFWTSGLRIPEASVEAHCDMVYTLVLTGRDDEIAPAAIEQFVAFLAGLSLPGWTPLNDRPPILVHNCAYAFGALNLLFDTPAPLYDAVLAGRQEDLAQIIDPETSRPVLPRKWVHHNWRISHWIGGVPAMVLSLARSGFARSRYFESLFDNIRNATDAFIDSQTGLLKAYKSELIQGAFRILYSARHNPDLGDVGGVAHILWVDHATGREYVGLEAVLAHAQTLFRASKPFMESVPYCLDFDVVQIVRTGLEQSQGDRGTDAARAEIMLSDIEAFFAAKVPDAYTLHKIPGALATYHECALLCGCDITETLGTPARDVIKSAHWL